MKKFELPPHHNEHVVTSHQLWTTILGLDVTPGIEFLEDQGSKLISVDPSIPYPTRQIGDIRGAEGILLTPLDEKNPSVLVLPDNCTTLSAVLNEAAGATNSLGVPPSESRTVQIILGAFDVLAHSVHDVAEKTHLLPTNLDYKQILVLKDTHETKLLPPLELRTFRGRKQFTSFWAAISGSLLASLSEGANSPTQWELVGKIRKPVEEIFAKEIE